MPCRNSLFLVVSILFCLTAANAADKPNVIFILADDLGYGDLSHAGGKARTPHCDRLAWHPLECGGRAAQHRFCPTPSKAPLRLRSAGGLQRKRGRAKCPASGV
jgi:hypothetical protein